MSALAKARAKQKVWRDTEWRSECEEIKRKLWKNHHLHGGARTRKRVAATTAAQGNVGANSARGAAANSVHSSGAVERQPSAATRAAPLGDSRAHHQPLAAGAATSATCVARLGCGGGGLAHVLKFTVESKLGQGTFGHVYSATLEDPLPPDWLRAERRVAVKVIRKSLGEPSHVEAERREIHIMQKLADHANVIKLLHWRETTFDIHLFLPLYERDLSSHIRTHKGTTADDGRTMSRQLLSAVAYVHMNKIMHRDIKPTNVLVQCQPLAAVLGDFGISRDLQGVRVPGKPLTPDVTTHHYRAPEVFLLNGEYSFAVDMWSLGVVAVEMEQAAPPFGGKSGKETFCLICDMFGSPVRENMPSLPRGVLLKIQKRQPYKMERPMTCWPWGNKFGDSFRTFTKLLLSLEPTRRSIILAQRHQWLLPP